MARWSKRVGWYVMLLGVITMSGVCGCRESRSERIERYMNRAYELRETGEDEKAFELLLDAQALVDESVSPKQKVNLYTALMVPYYDSYAYRFGAAKEYAKKAVEVARDADSLQWLPGLLWNLILNTTDTDSVIFYLRECRDLSDLYGDRYMALRSRIFIAKAIYLKGDFTGAETIFDSIAKMEPELQNDHKVELAMERAWMYRHNGENEKALEILGSVSPDSLSLDGKRTRYEELYEISRTSGRFEKALVYRDSLSICQDSINSIISSEKLSDVENNYFKRLMREEAKQRLLWWVGGTAVLILIIVIVFLNKNRAMKSRQVKLIERISELNVRLAELENSGNPQPSNTLSPLIEKLCLTKEFYFTLPQSGLVSQLNMMPNPDDIPKEKIKTFTESIIGSFSEVFANLRQAIPSLTQDDALLCLLNYIGVSKDVSSAVMRSSEDALRKRKSRIKQKLPSELFNLFFSKSV
ncbi:MAG: hypothetical protein K2H60_09010 [Muribaculaceae bacterium]|nr:hypothetical protein [Muribaculaceae bacterium]